MFDNYPEGLTQRDWEHIYGGVEEEETEEKDKKYIIKIDGAYLNNIEEVEESCVISGTKNKENAMIIKDEDIDDYTKYLDSISTEYEVVEV